MASSYLGVTMNYKKMIALDSLFEGGRMFVGATSITYLMSQGLDVSQISLLKSIQAITIVFGEYPTGLIADYFGRKKSLYLGLITAILGFLTFALGKSIFIFFIAEILTALSLCFWSGAYEAYSIEVAQLDSEKGLMDKFFHSNQSFNSASVLIFGALGGFIAEKSLALPYLSGIAVLTTCFFILYNAPKENLILSSELNQRKNIFFHIRNSLQEGIFSVKLFPFVLSMVAIQFSTQPLLHLWQPFFAEINGQQSSSLNSYVFSFYCFMNMGAGFLAARFSKKVWFRSKAFLLTTLASFSLLYLIMSYLQSPIWALIFFGINQGVLSVGRTTLSVRMNQKITAHSRASILSSVSLFSRFGMLAALQWIQLLNLNSQKTIHVFNNFAVLTTAVMTFLILVFSFKYFLSKKEHVNENAV